MRRNSTIGNLVDHNISPKNVSKTRRIFFSLILSTISFWAYSQPTFNSLIVNSTNTQATVNFSAPVGQNPAVNQNLTPTEFTVTVSASLNGGGVSAGSVTVTVSHTAPSAIATLSFTITGGSSADGSEILTVKPASGTSIYDAGGAMLSTESITANLKDLLAPSFSSTAPASSSSVNNTIVSYTLSEALTSGTITWLGTAGPDNGNSHAQVLSASERTSGAHTNITLSSPPTLVNGSTYSITFAGSDAAGNVATPVVKTNVVFDTSPPAAPSTPVFASADDTGSSNSDGITKNTTNLTFTGTAESGSSVQLYNGASPVGSPATATGGNWSIDLALAEGTYSINAKATDAAGNTGAASANFALIVDTTPPGQPAPPDMTAGTDLGISSTDNITKDNTPDFTGSGTNGNSITITSSVNGAVGTGTVSSGNYTITVSTLTEGAHNMTVIETDLAGNASVASNSLAITIDITPPSAPSIPNLQAASDTGLSSTDDITNDNTPTFDVTGTTGLLLEILDGSTPVASITATAGPDALTTSGLSDGVKSITARTTDVAGNTASSAALSVTIDTTPPSAPTTPDLVAGSDTGSSSTDNNTSDNTPDFSVTGTTGLQLEILFGGSTVIASTASATGVAQTLTSSALSDGSYSITARTTDVAGNTATSAALNPVVIDTTPPGQPALPDMTAGTDTGVSSTDNLTNDNTPDFTGTGTNGSTITITSSVNGVVGTGTVSGGTYTITLSTLTEGAHNITVVETDLAGNSSIASNALAITIDITPPGVAPSTPDLQAASDSGLSSTDDNTNDNTPTFDVTGTAGLLLEILDGSTVVASLASATGGVDALTTSTLTDGAKSITARTSDAAGNSISSAPLSVTIDTTPPTTPPTPDLVAGSDSGTSSTDNITNDNTPDFDVTGTSGFKLEILVGGSTVIAQTPSATGAVQTLTSSLLTDASYSVTVRVTDVAGNTSTSTALNPLVIDTAAPSAPGTPDLTAGTDLGLSNTDNITKSLTPSFSVASVVSGNTVSIFSSVDTPGTARGSAVAAGTSVTVPTTLVTQGNNQTHSITAKQTDPAGNISAASSGLTITVDATPPTVTGATFYADNSNASWVHYFSCSGATTTATSNTEMFHLTMSEPMGMVDGTLVAVGASAGFIVDVDGAGATAASTSTIDVTCEGGGSPRGASVYHSSGSIIHLKSSNNNDWSGSTTYSFTPNNTNVIDVAGNELGTITNGVAADNQPPALASGIVLNLNGSSPETLVFSLDEALNIAVTNNVVGFSVNQGSIDGLVNNYNSATQTVTLTSVSDGMWDDLVTVTYTQQGGGGSALRVRDPADNEMLAFTQGVFFQNLSIASNNAVNTAYATTGDNIILNFTTLRALSGLPTVTIGGVVATSVTNPSGNDYQAYLTNPGSAPPTEGAVVTFQIDAPEAAITTTTTATTSPAPTGSFVTVDRIAPSTPTAPDLASGSDSNITTDDVTNVATNLVFQGANGTVENNATVQIFDNTTLLGSTTANGSGAWTYTHTGTLSDGVHPINIKARDAAGNLSAASTSLNVTVDTTPPTVTSIAFSSTLKGIGTTNGIEACSTCANTFVDFLVTFSETNTPLSGIDATDFTVSNTGTVNYSGTLNVPTTSATTRTVSIVINSGYGKISLGLSDNNTIIDLAGNPLAGASDGSVATTYTGNQYYTIVGPEPGTDPLILSTGTVTQNSISLSVNNGNADSPKATHFLILAKPTTGGSYPTVVDGTPISDGTYVKNVARSGVNTLIPAFTPLNSGTSYNFRVYKYTLEPNTSPDNIDYELTSYGDDDNVVTNTATTSWVVQNSSPVSISSIASSSTPASVMNFTIYDDGLDPISPNVMNFNDNGLAPETITFTLRDQLPLGNGALLSGFSASSTGIISNAVYSGASTNIVTLTSPSNGAWTSGTTISYNATTGNIVFNTLGKMQSIQNHPVAASAATTINFTIPGSSSFIVPAGVTSLVVEVWGGGGSGGQFLTNVATYGYGSSSGGGGGGYSRKLISVTPGASYPVSVGAGGPGFLGSTTYTNGGNDGTASYFGNASTVYAEGGQGGWNNDWTDYYFTAVTAYGNNGNGGSAANGVGDVKFSGGNGGIGYGNGGAAHGVTYGYGGGGGSSASSTANGNPGSTGSTCCASTLGGSISGGGTGGLGTYGTPGGNGTTPGGGGGGTSGLGPYVSGAGGNGQVKVTYYAPASSGTSDWAGDNSPFKFSKIVFTQGTGNDPAFLNWQNIIADAELFDGTTTFNNTTNPGGVTINSNDITFNNIPSDVSGKLGYIDDANGTTSSKTYTLKIWLRNDLPFNGTGLSGTIDGKNLAFALDLTNAANLSYDDASNNAQKSSRLTSPAPSLQSGSKQIQVIASQLAFHSNGDAGTRIITDVPASIGVGVPFSSSSAAVPTVYALDANNNLDLDYNYSASISSSLSYLYTPSSISFTGGKVLLSPFYFTTGSSTPVSTILTFKEAAGGPGATDALSTGIWPVISSITKVDAGPLLEPSTISSVATALTGAVSPQQNAVVNFDFTISDDFGANTSTFVDNDALPTLFDQIKITQGAGTDIEVMNRWDEIIAGAELRLTSTTGSQLVPQVVSNSVFIGTDYIQFNSIANGIGNPGRVDDGKVNTYQLKIYLKSSIVDPLLADAIDNHGFEFVASSSDFNPTGLTSVISATNASSGATNNRISVLPYQIDFINQWAANANQSYDAPLTPTPTAKVRDANGNLDIDYNTAVSVATTPSPATYPVVDVVDATPLISISGGVITFDPTINISSASGGVNGATETLVLTSGIYTSAGSGPGKTGNPFILNYSAGSDVVHDHGTYSFSHPTDILYATSINQGSATGAANIIDDNTEGTAMEQFVITDGPDADGTNTNLDAISFKINNAFGYDTLTGTWVNQIRQLALFAGSSSNPFATFPGSSIVSSTAPTPGPDGIANLTGLSGFSVTDDSNLELTVQAIFNTSKIVDNTQITFEVNSLTPAGVSSTFLNGTPGLVGTVAPTENKIEVVATKIDFTTQPDPNNISTYSNISSPYMVAEARDANANRDFDYNGAVGTVTNSGTTGTGPGSELLMNALPAGNFDQGLYLFRLSTHAENFQFYEDTSTEPGNVVTLTLPAPGLTDGTTDPFKIAASRESWVTAANQYDNTYSPSPTIPYQNFQEPNDLTAANSFELIRLALGDGDADYFQNGNVPGTELDVDGANTVLSSLTIKVKNYQTIRRIGIYDGNTELQELTPGSFTIIAPDSAHITFSGLGITALDNNHKFFSIRASFFNSSTVIIDNTVVRLGFVDATLGGGSKFYDLGGYIAGNPPTNVTAPTNINVIDVVATSLDFTTQPGVYAGINEPIGKQSPPQTGTPYVTVPGLPTTTAGVVKARDKFGNVDLEFNYTSNQFTVSGAGAVNSNNFVNGVLTLDGMEYATAGNGTLTILANGINSSTPTVNTTGTISASTGSTTVTGNLTKFLTELDVNDSIYNASGTFIGKVQSVASNTTLTLEANSAINVSAGSSFISNSIIGRLVNVVHVNATYPTGDATIIQGSGIPATYSIKGGSLAQPIYGVTFTAFGATATEPKLSSFTIQFANPAGGSTAFRQLLNGNTTDIFSNFRILQGTNDITSTNVTLSFSQSQASISAGDDPGSQDRIKVTLNTPVSLAAGPVTFYLQADVDASANLTTPNLQPYLYDGGYNILDLNSEIADNNIVTTVGTATGDAPGVIYTFASTKPPVLITYNPIAAGDPVTSSSIPYAGQLNVDANISQIKLLFDVQVISLDGVAELYNRNTNTKVADLTAVPGLGNFTSVGSKITDVTNPLTFNIQYVSGQGPALKPDEVYYVKVAQGTFSNGVGTGIADRGLNFFGGISSNTILYFKVASDKAPVMSYIASNFSTPDLVNITTQFDQFGKVYYLIVPSGSPAPTTDEIKNGTYIAVAPTATGNYAITQININQTATITIPSPGFVPSVNYDVYVFAENDAPTPIPSGLYNTPGNVYQPGASVIPGYFSEYAGPTYKADNTAPSLVLMDPGSNTFTVTTPINNSYPQYKICPNSFVNLSDPIIIGETAMSDFYRASGTPQTFNILLPNGYEFDITQQPTIDKIGSDFSYVNTYFSSNSVLTIEFLNQSSTSLDYFVISNYKVRGVLGSSPNPIKLFYGDNTFSTQVGDIGYIQLFSTKQFTFENSYSIANRNMASGNAAFPNPPFTIYDPNASANVTDIVNYIPDNYIERYDPTITEGTVRLFPLITTPNDYNASSFSGNGVTNDVLTLSAVTKGAAFNIVMSHTDPNGCISTKSLQYLVYDHRNPITNNLGNGNITNPSIDKGTAQGLNNANLTSGNQTNLQVLLSNSTTNTTINSAAIPSPTFAYNDLAGYFLTGIIADIPASEKYLNSIGQQSQIMSGADWSAQLIKVPTSASDPNSSTAVGGPYTQFTWDYSHILNALTEAASNPGDLGTITVHPYNGSSTTTLIEPSTITSANPAGSPFSRNFISTTNRGQNYWTGGSLGKIEFTGTFRSSADLTVYVPFRQEVELFVAPVPLVEVDLSKASPTTDNLDPNSPVIYCENGGDINISGFPAASANSKGVFTITDLAGNNLNPNSSAIAINPNVLPFIDNGNGTAVLKPFLISNSTNVGFTNAYQDFKINYTFQENNSPAFGTAFIIIRITPNPTALFTVNSNISLANPIFVGNPVGPNSYCVNNLIDYADISDFPLNAKNNAIANGYAPYQTIRQNWDFGDLSTDLTGVPNTSHSYGTNGAYVVKLGVQSQYGCASLSNTSTPSAPVIGSTQIPISVGAIPVPGFDMTGTSVSEQFAVTSTAVVSGSTISNTYYDFNWKSGVPSTATTNNSYPYTNPGHYNVAQLVQSALGCQIASYRHIIILPSAKPDLNSPYVADFEDDSQGWQTGRDTVNVNGLNSLGPNRYNPTRLFYSSWKYGPAANKTTIKNDPSVVDLKDGTIQGDGGKIWATGLSSTELTNPGERSFLFTPLFDLSSLTRPMITFNSAFNFSPNAGVVLQYSLDDKNVADPTKKWTGIGELQTGVGWYNVQGIGSNPGDGSFITPDPEGNGGDNKYYGWSTNSGTWQQSKHTLLQFLASKPKVVFRFAFAAPQVTSVSDTTTNITNLIGEGFGVDNFRIGERTRTVLFENFANTSNSAKATINGASVDAEKNQSDYFMNTAALQVSPTLDLVKLNYHTAFPDKDPFNLDNASVPSGRALYYGITKTPYAIMDGSPNKSPYIEEWGVNELGLRSLELAKADLSLVTTVPGVSYSIDVNIVAREELAPTTILHVALAERNINADKNNINADETSKALNLLVGSTTTLGNSGLIKTGETKFEYVVKTMLPSASGTRFATALSAGSTRSFHFDYTPELDHYYSNTSDPNSVNDIVVVVFLQDELSKEVHQATIGGPFTDPTAVTGDLNNPFEFKDVSIYPNPADQELNIVFPTTLLKDVPISMFDQMGRITHSIKASKGNQAATLKTDGVSSGVYILQMDLGDGRMSRVKVIIEHKD